MAKESNDTGNELPGSSEASSGAKAELTRETIFARAIYPSDNVAGVVEVKSTLDK